MLYLNPLLCAEFETRFGKGRLSAFVNRALAEALRNPDYKLEITRQEVQTKLAEAEVKKAELTELERRQADLAAKQELEAKVLEERKRIFSEAVACHSVDRETYQACYLELSEKHGGRRTFRPTTNSRHAQELIELWKQKRAGTLEQKTAVAA